MPVLAYNRWLALGKPLEPAQPIRDVVDRMKVAYPKGDAADMFSWYANDAHYTAVPAEDHTPFSQTGWPLPSPQWWVFATDIGHRPDLGVDCNVLFAYWLSEAKAGRMPWLKYLIWQAKLYDVRNAWHPQANSDHFDHIHISARTDFKDIGLGSWSITPTVGGVEMGMFYATCIEDESVWAIDGAFRWNLGTGGVNVQGVGFKARDAAYGFPWPGDTPNPKIFTRLERAAIQAMAPVDVTGGLPQGGGSGGLVEHTHVTEGATGPAIPA